MTFSTLNAKITLTVSLGPGQTGKTVGYTLYNGDGSVYQARTTTGVTEIAAGSGIYKAELAASVFTAAFDGYVLWDVAGAAPYAAEDITVTADIPAIKAKTDLLGTSTVTVTAPVLASGKVTLVQGDDYKAADGRALAWTSASWPSLTGASSVQLKLRNLQTGEAAAASGTAPTATNVQVELAAAFTAPLEIGSYAYVVRATLADGDVATLASGTAVVSPAP